jgi:YVTN family beta-propeller protein
MHRAHFVFLFSLLSFTAVAQSPMAVAHAHNDYVHARPFFEASELGFSSIEVDVWLVDGTLLVGHDRQDLKPERTFQKLYLDPLLSQLKTNGGKAYPDGRPLQLLVDLKSDWASTLPVLEKLLLPHRAALAPAVRIVSSGSMPPPEQYGKFDPLLTFDGRRKTRYSAEAAKRVPLVSEPFYALSGIWNGKTALAEPARQRVRAFADSLHAAGKQLRFWATPDTPLAYQTLLELGVDFVGTDDLNGLSSFLKTRPRLTRHEAQSTLSTDRWLISAPAGDRFTGVKPEGETVIPNGRIVKPLGQTTRIAPHPYGLTLSADGKTAITANSGTNPFSISILQNVLTGTPTVYQIPNSPKTDDDLLGAVFMGLAISPDDKFVYVAGGTTNKIFIFDLATRKKVGEILGNKSFEGTDFSDGYLGDLVLTRDGTRLYCVDQIGFRLLVVDTKRREVIANVPTGRYPFGVTLSPDEKTVYVANIGMFQYQFARHIDRKRIKQTAMKFPPFAYGSKEARDGIKTDSVDIPGLGDPNVPESFSVWAIDAGTRQVRAKVKTGILVGEKVEGIPAVGGSSPNSLVATDRYVFVSNGNNDNVSVIDPKAGTVVQTIDLRLDERLGRWRGAIPFGLAISPDQKRLYVAESGINAVAVIDVPTMRVLGHLPVGWFPSKLKVSPDGKKLVVANAKGYGSGPNGGPTFKVGPEGSYIGSLMKGSVTVLDLPADAELAKHTAQVVRNNFAFEPYDIGLFKNNPNPVPLYPGEKESPIQYLVFISKENRTYDEVFGQLKTGRGEPSLARFGYDVSFANSKKTAQVANAIIMPNHLALAKRFGTADNFYVDSDHSADGHRWLSNVYPNEWMETHVSAAYGGKRNFNPDSKAPGKFAFIGSSGSFYPEDYNQDGSMWEHLDRHGIPFYNFGFTTEQEGSVSDSTMKVAGEVYTVNYPLPAPMFANTSRTFPTYNMAIPDQYRADVFIKEFSEKFLGQGKTMPRFLPLMLPNDHGAGERPAAGYPFRESYMADNDLAVGRVVEFLSRTPYWKNMAIFVTEDDAQGGIDHVDAHRSILQVYSPYAKKNFVSHRHYSFGSLFKTFWNLLGIPYLNQYDAGANDLSDFFTDQPDFTPYSAVPVDPRVFDPKKALTPLDEKFDWKALKDSPVLDDEDYLRKDRAAEDEKILKQKELQANPRLYPKKKTKP